VQTARSRYEEYINSDAWAERRRSYFDKHPRRCTICKTTRRIHLHHVSYERMGQEPDGDLVALCEFHHAALHDWHRAQWQRSLGLRQASAEFIANKGFARVPKTRKPQYEVVTAPPPRPKSRSRKTRNKDERRAAFEKRVNGPTRSRRSPLVAGSKRAVLPMERAM
jgi:hypothetical protein